MCGDSYKLGKMRFRQYLAQKYGPILADKLQAILDFNGPVLDFQNFQHQLETLLKDRDLML